MELNLDRAMYEPSSQAVCQVTAIPAGAAMLRATLYHLDQVVSRTQQAADQHTVTLRLPGADYTGYLLYVEALDASESTFSESCIAMDCSSTWKRFPRYGYIWDYTLSALPEEKIALLNRYHINGLQFYDWQYRHHLPVPPDRSLWKDWSGRTISGQQLEAYISAAHKRGMICMAYNMIYAANGTYLEDGSGVNPSWRLVKQSGENFTCDMDASLGLVGILQYFNPLNPQWQQYIFAKENEVFSAFHFDGWHGDTIGENGPMQTPTGDALGYDATGNPTVLVKDCYAQFLNAAKAAIGQKYLVFNPVGAQGIEQVNQSDVDVLYAEFWPWDCDDRGLPYTDYYSIHRAIQRAQEQSGGKSLVVAAYVNYKNPSNCFHDPAVLLMDAVVFASGGARIELGNGDGMLSNEYFPADGNKRMSAELQAAVTRMYDFITAYENLLRDGQRPLERRVTLEGCAVSTCSEANAVWCFSRGDAKHEIYHFINLLGTDALWRDEAQSKPAPVVQEKLKAKIYTDFGAATVCLASPDGADLRSQALPFELGRDEGGAFITFSMPILSYWNMVFLR